MTSKTDNKNRIILVRAAGLLVVPVILSAILGMAKVEPTGLPLQGELHMTKNSIAETVFQNDWGSPNPEVYARIAIAFSAESLDGADLKRVECRSTLCKVVYEADSDIKVNRILPRQLAETFNTMVTVHSARSDDRETLVYIDVPSNS